MKDFKEVSLVDWLHYEKESMGQFAQIFMDDIDTVIKRRIDGNADAVLGTFNPVSRRLAHDVVNLLCQRKKALIENLEYCAKTMRDQLIERYGVVDEHPSQGVDRAPNNNEGATTAVVQETVEGEAEPSEIKDPRQNVKSNNKNDGQGDVNDMDLDSSSDFDCSMDGPKSKLPNWIVKVTTGSKKMDPLYLGTGGHREDAKKKKVMEPKRLTFSPISRSTPCNPKNGVKAKPLGRKNAYSFFVQSFRKEHNKKSPGERIMLSDFSRQCAQRWKNLSATEKDRFEDMAKCDKTRYEVQMRDYVPPKGEKRPVKKRRDKDANAPKRPVSAFIWFCNDERPKLKRANPELGLGVISKELGRHWTNASQNLKLKYEAVAERDKARYAREMAAYNKNKTDAVPVNKKPDNSKNLNLGPQQQVKFKQEQMSPEVLIL